nr:MAG TPA: hypothetical protein [Caudoviricetes sp.]
MSKGSNCTFKAAPCSQLARNNLCVQLGFMI